MKLISYQEAKRIDIVSQERYAIPPLLLMERAGIESARILRSLLKGKETVLVLCGGGNNGGDGLVVAREIHNQGYEAHLCLLSECNSDISKQEYTMLESLSIPRVSPEELESRLSTLKPHDWIVDAISGIGLVASYRNPSLITAINQSKASVFSIDVPTGLLEHHHLPTHTSIPVVHAHTTVTMGCAKTAMYIAEQRKYSGNIYVISEVFPREALDDAQPDAYLIDYESAHELIAPLDENVYKYTRGAVGVVAGSHTSPGAAILASEAASKGPAGVVYGFFDEDVAPLVVTKVPSVITGTPLTQANIIHALIIGPGWGKNRTHNDLMYLLETHLPSILDADALSLVADIQFPFPHEPIFTPHLGELRTLARAIPTYDEAMTNTTHWWTMAQDVADHYGAVVVAKHSVTCISYPSGTPLLLDGSNPLLATGGSGDVLAGIMGSILAFNQSQIAQKQQSFADRANTSEGILKKIGTHISSQELYETVLVAILGVLVHMEAGNLVRETQGSANANDVIKKISNIYVLV